MNREEYESRRRRLDEERRAAIELFEAAHRAQLWALELVWLTSPENQGDPGTPPRHPGFPQEAGGSPGRPDGAPAAWREAVPAAPAPVTRAAAQPRKNRKAGELYYDVLRALETLPAEFDKNDVARALGYEPHRGTLRRILQELEEDGLVRVAQMGAGNQGNRYRNLRPAAAGAAPGDRAGGEDRGEDGEAGRGDGPSA